MHPGGSDVISIARRPSTRPLLNRIPDSSRPRFRVGLTGPGVGLRSGRRRYCVANQGGGAYMSESDLQRSGDPAGSGGRLTELVERAISGDQSAWDAITDRFNDLLWAIARSHRLSRDEASDVVQTVWLRLIEHLDRIREPERLAGWLSATARHECISFIRRSRREQVSWNGEEVYDSDAPQTPIDLNLLDEERDANLWLAYRQLPERCQALLRILMATDPTSYTEVARTFDMPVGSIGPTRMRCLDRLRRILADSDYPFNSTDGGETS